MTSRSIIPVLILAVLLTACGAESENDETTDDQLASEEADQGILPKDIIYPFHGKWANSFTDCTLEPGSAEAAPILITPGEFIGYENSCTLTNVVVVSEAEGRYQAMRQCSAEGAVYEDMVMFRALGDTLMMAGEGGNVTWTRCPDGPQGE